MTHEQLIAACFQWHWNTYPDERRMLFGVNNNSFNRIEGNKNKAKGVVPGVFDFCYVTRNRCVWLDAKVGNDRPSKEQLDFMAKVTTRGHIAMFFTSFEEFQAIIKSLHPVNLRY